MQIAWILLCIVSLAAAQSATRYHDPEPRINSYTTFQNNSSIVEGTGGTSTANTVNVWKGSQSNRLTAGAVNVGFVQTLSPAINICSDSMFRITYRFDSKATVMNLARLDIAFRTNSSNYIVREFFFFVRDSILTRYGDWTHQPLERRSFTQTGTFDCANVTSIRITLRAQAALQDTITFGEVGGYRSRMKTGVLMITADDNYKPWFLLGKPITDSLGFCTTNFVNGGELGFANKVTARELDSIYKNPPGLLEIGDHLWRHDTACTISADSMSRSSSRNNRFFRSWGWMKGQGLAALPYGESCFSADSVFRYSGITSFQRGVRITSLGEAHPYPNMFAIKTVGALGNTITLAQTKTIIDTLVIRKTSGIFFGHNLCDGCTTDGVTWDVADYRAMVLYAKQKVDAGQLQVMCIGDFLEKRGGPGNHLLNIGIGP